MNGVFKGAQMYCSALVCCLDEAVVAAVRSNSLAELWGVFHRQEMSTFSGRCCRSLDYKTTT